MYEIKQTGRKIGTICAFTMGSETKVVSLTGKEIIKGDQKIKPPTQSELDHMFKLGIDFVVKVDKKAEVKEDKK